MVSAPVLRGIFVCQNQLIMVIKGKCSLILRKWFFILVLLRLCLHLNLGWNKAFLDSSELILKIGESHCSVYSSK